MLPRDIEIRAEVSVQEEDRAQTLRLGHNGHSTLLGDFHLTQDILGCQGAQSSVLVRTGREHLQAVHLAYGVTNGCTRDVRLEVPCRPIVHLRQKRERVQDRWHVGARERERG